MPACLVIEAHVTDPRGSAAHARATPPVVARHGGRYLVTGGEQASLEGEHAPVCTVVPCWPDPAAALASRHSPEYAAIRPPREGTGRFRVLPADGAEATPLPDTGSRVP